MVDWSAMPDAKSMLISSVTLSLILLECPSFIRQKWTEVQIQESKCAYCVKSLEYDKGYRKQRVFLEIRFTLLINDFVIFSWYLTKQKHL